MSVVIGRACSWRNHAFHAKLSVLLDTFGFSLVLWSVLGWNVCFCACWANVPCTGACCRSGLWYVVRVLHGVLVGGGPPLLLHLPPRGCRATAAPDPFGVLYLMSSFGCDAGDLLGSTLPKILCDFCVTVTTGLHCCATRR